MRHRIYLDTHFIDYLWDHRIYIWEGERATLEHSFASDRSSQFDEYVVLGQLPGLCWCNDWHIVIGECVLDELEDIPDQKRREALLGYAEQLRTLDYIGLEGSAREVDLYAEARSLAGRVHPLQFQLPGFNATACRVADDCDFPLSLARALALLPPKDRPLVQEAAMLGCDVFLTTDDQLIKRGHGMEYWLGVLIRKPTDFISEEAARGELNEIDDVRVFPDLLLYTGMIPGNTF